MGRKIDIKMIENATRRQVTYSKRRASLIKKAHELSVFCDVDVLLLVFSPSRRVTTYCSRNRIEDLLKRFINLPTVKKYEKNPNMKNVAEKLERLKGIESIIGDENKLHYLNNRINHLELQKKKSAIDLELLSATLRDFEPPSGDQEDHAVAQVMLCMRNLNNSLQKVLDRKSMLLGNRPSLVDAQSSIGDDMGTGDDLRKMIETVGEDLFLAYNFGGIELNRKRQNPNTSGLIRHLDPWLSPYSNKARERILEGASGQLRSGVNGYTPIPQSAPTFPTMPPRVPSGPSPPNYFHAPHQYYFGDKQPQLPTRTSSHPPPPPPPPCNQAQQQRAINRPFPPQLRTAANWMPPPAMYNQQQEDALENPFMSYSNWNHGEGSSSQFQANPIEQGIPEGIDFTVQPNTAQAPNQQSYQNENNHGNSHVVANANDKSSELIGEILAQHQLCSNTVNYSSHEVANVENDDGHVENFLVQDQLEDDDNNNNSNEVSEEIEINPSANIDEILAIQHSETEIISLDALFEEIEKMESGKEGNQESGSTEWDGFALAQSLNTTDFDITNLI